MDAIREQIISSTSQKDYPVSQTLAEQDYQRFVKETTEVNYNWVVDDLIRATSGNEPTQIPAVVAHSDKR